MGDDVYMLLAYLACVVYVIFLDIVCTFRLADIYGESWLESKIRKLAERPFGGIAAFLIYYFGVNPPKHKA